MPETMAPRSPSPLWALALSVGAVFLVAYPALLSPADTLLGGTFIYGHLWAWEMFIRGLLDHGTIVYASDALNYPVGGRVSFIGASHLLPLIGLRAAGVPLILGTNLITALHMVAGCYFGHRLYLRLTGAWGASLVGGLIFGLSPYTLSLVSNGQLPKLTVGLIPLALLFLMDLPSARRPWAAVWCGLILALIFASSPYTGVFCAVLLTMGGCYLLWKAPGSGRRRLMGRLGLASITSAVAATPFTVYYIVTQAKEGEVSLLQPAGTLQEAFGDYQFSASLSGWFNPWQGWVPHPDGSMWDVFHLNYLGWVVLGLLVLALVLRRRFPGGDKDTAPLRPAFFLLTGLVFVVLAHGPELRVGEWRVPLPLSLLWDHVPKTKTLYVTYRAVGVVAMCLTSLGVWALAALIDRAPRLIRLLVCVGVAGLFLAETFFVSPSPCPVKTHPVPVPQVYRDLARTADCGAVLVAPYEAHNHNLSFEPHRYYQIIHRHPLAHTVLGTPLLKMGRFNTELTRAITGRPPEEPDTYKGKPTLHFRYVILRERLILPQWLRGTHSFLGRELREVKRYPADRIRLYETRPADGNGPTPAFPRAPNLPQRCLDR